jgi:hypothetical protein
MALTPSGRSTVESRRGTGKALATELTLTPAAGPSDRVDVF